MTESVKEQIVACQLEEQRQEVLKEFSKDLPIQLRTHLQGMKLFKTCTIKLQWCWTSFSVQQIKWKIPIYF